MSGSYQIKPAQRLRIIPFVLIFLSLACSMPNIVGVRTPTPPITPAVPTLTMAPDQPTGTPQRLPPTLIESAPPEKVEIPPDGSITLYFNQPMDRNSVKPSITSEVPIDGHWAWADELTLIFTPDEPIKPGTDLTLLIEEGLSEDGLPITEPISLTYRTVGELQLAQSLPEPEAQEVDPSSAVVASYNHPIVSLGADPASLPAGLTLEPAAQGHGEWLNTSTYIFYPDPPLAGGQVYQVSVDPSLRGADGSRFEDQVPSWSFTTAMPLLLSIDPIQGSQEVRLDKALTLEFNQPMDSTSVESNFTLTGPDGSLVSGAFGWNELFTTLTFTPTQMLGRGTTYTANLNGNAQARGGTPLGASISSAFTTVPGLAVKSSTPAQGSTLPTYQGLSVTFTAPLTEADPLQWISLTPAVSNLDYNWWSPGGQELMLFGDFAPSTTYTLTIAPEIPDAWGVPMGLPYSLYFQTAPLDPALTITTGSNELFLTPQDPGVIAQVTNLSQLPIEVSGLTLDDYVGMFGSEAYEFRQNFEPQEKLTWGQNLSLPPNQPQAVTIPLTPDGSQLDPGLYWLNFNLNQSGYFSGPFLVVVSNIHLTYKTSATDALVWATDLRTRTPVAGAPIRLLGADGKELASGDTDDQGVFTTTIPTQSDPYSVSYAVMGQPGQEDFALTYSNWSQGISAWDFGLTSDTSEPRLKAYLYTDRPIYRPGQTVYFRAVARQAFNGRYSLPEQGSLPLVLSDGNGKQITTYDLALSAYGTAHGEYVLPPEAQPGMYTFYSEPAQAYLTFQVANYRKPEINLQAEFVNKRAQTGDLLKARLNAQYFFGAPAGSLPVHWALYAASDPLSVSSYQIGPEGSNWLDAFYIPNYSDSLGTLVTEGDFKTDPDGEFVLELGSEVEDLRDRNGDVDPLLQYQRRRYTLELTAKDESGLPVSTRATVDVNPEAYYAALRPDRRVGKAGESIGFEVQTVDAFGDPAGARDLHAEFQKVVWERQERTAASRGQAPEFIPRYTLVGSTDFTTSDQGQARLAFTPPEPGTYQLTVTGRDAGDDNVRTELLLWAAGDGQAVWPELPNSRLHLTADRAEGERYFPGDTAQIFIPNPFSSGAQALVTIERGVILRHQLLTLDGAGSTLSLPLSEEDAPNVYVSVTVMDPNQEESPDFRQGYLELAVKPVIQTLNVSLTREPEVTGPGEEVRFEIQVSNSYGEPVEGEFSLAVVDQAVLTLAEANSDDILPAFYGSQPLGVRTSLALVVYPQRNTYLPGGMGGGGGAAEAESVVRENFPDTAYWNAQVVTDANGRAEVTLPLPDNLTTWKVDLRGLTVDTLVGQASTQVVTTKDLLIRPALPRFLVAGDRTRLAAVVQNNTDRELETQVALEASGFALDESSPTEETVTIPAGGRALVEWWGTAQDVETLDLIFSAQSGNLQDLVRPEGGKLPVLHYTAPQTFRTAGVLSEAGEQLETVSLPRSFDPSGGSLSLELSPSLAAAMMQSLDALENYPYDSIELTLSRFLPNLEAYRALQEFGVPAPEVETRLQNLTTQGIRRLEVRQNSETGAWAWWQEEGESDPYITAYVVYGLKRAQEAGFAVDVQGLNAAITYLQSQSSEISRQTDPLELNRLAFQHFALAQAGSGDPASLEALNQVKDQLDPWAQALLALSFEKLQPGNEVSRTLLSDLEAKAVRTSAGAHWEMLSPQGVNLMNHLSNSAMVIFALAQRDPGNPLLNDAVRYLMSQRESNGMWSSTYATAWATMALTEVLRGTGEMGGDFSFSATLNGAPLASGDAGGPEQLTPVSADVPISNLYPDDPNALVITREAGAGRLYYSAILNVYQPVDAVEPISRGLTISRAYYPSIKNCPQAACEPLESAGVGQSLQVRLTLNLQQEAHHLLVEDYIPAGAEILDPQLKTIQRGQLEGLPEGTPPPSPWEPSNPYKNGWGWWLFQQPQIFDDHIAWAADYLPAGNYELTYTLVTLQPGSYQVLPARAWMLYFPEVQGTSAGRVFEILP